MYNLSPRQQFFVPGQAPHTNYFFFSLERKMRPFNKNPFSSHTESRPAQLYNGGGRSASWPVFWFKELDISFAVTENKDRERRDAGFILSLTSARCVRTRYGSFAIPQRAAPCARGWTMWVQPKTSNKNKTWWVYQNRQPSQSQSSVRTLDPSIVSFFASAATRSTGVWVLPDSIWEPSSSLKFHFW